MGDPNRHCCVPGRARLSFRKEPADRAPSTGEKAEQNGQTTARQEEQVTKTQYKLPETVPAFNTGERLSGTRTGVFFLELLFDVALCTMMITS